MTIWEWTVVVPDRRFLFARLRHYLRRWYRWQPDDRMSMNEARHLADEVSELMDIVRQQDRHIERLQAALQFYADPSTYHAVAMIGDAPCGEIVRDQSWCGDEWGCRLGKRARRALGVSIKITKEERRRLRRECREERRAHAKRQQMREASGNPWWPFPHEETK